jgi:Holliday junction resolvase RusA-like endonuclease
MTRTLTITIPGRPPTPNARFGNVHAQRREEKAWRQTACRVGVDARNRSGWTAPARARITLTFTVPDRRGRDVDNLVGSTKVLTDGLVDAGVLIGDRSDVLAWGAPRVRIVKGVRATEYLIEELEEEAA